MWDKDLTTGYLTAHLAFPHLHISPTTEEVLHFYCPIGLETDSELQMTSVFSWLLLQQKLYII